MTEEIQNIKQEASEMQQEKAPRPARGKMRLWKKIIWGVVAIILIVVVVQIIIADKYKATVLPIEGEKKVGVNPTAELLDFGDLSRDTQAKRIVSLKSGGSDTYVWVIKFGALADLIKIDDNRFILKGGQEKKVEFSVYMPESAPIGKRMNGSVWIFKIPKIF